MIVSVAAQHDGLCSFLSADDADAGKQQSLLLPVVTLRVRQNATEQRGADPPPLGAPRSRKLTTPDAPHRVGGFSFLEAF